MKNLVIVESPTKARTISRFLGSDFVVESSFGHIRDLPASKLGVDVAKNFTPHYVIPPKAKSVVKKLKQEAQRADRIILATDEDREGEAIAWHLAEALDLDASKSSQVNRIVFHEITKGAIEDALAHPRRIDLKLVNAQQARRILDRIVGYTLSPFLWKKVYRGLSAGRVQSVAVRLIAEREREIQNFKPQEYWTLSALLQKSKTADEDAFEAHLFKIGETPLDKFALSNQDAAQKIIAALAHTEWSVANVEKRAVSKNPLPPFTTSTLQQDAFRRLGFSTKQTMVLAQQLYEGVELGEGSVGLITYMRTDSVNLSEESLKNAVMFLEKNLGANYALHSPRRFATKTKGAQEAHEAIRPTDPLRTPESIKNLLAPRQFKLYDLIWRRFIASQMPPAIFDATTVDIAAVASDQSPTASSQLLVTKYTFRASGQTIRFDGFLKVWPAKTKETLLPALDVREILALQKLLPQQHFTEPPPRYTEASLVKTLEQNGIGRPSTYAPTIATIQERGYVERHERRYLKPTEIGFVVNDLLVQHFPEIVDVQFTANMEDNLDEIAAGKKEWQPVLRSFYDPFAARVAEKQKEVGKITIEETTNEVCGICGKPMRVKLGRFGKFLACSGFPECKNTKPLAAKNPAETIGIKCPKCKEGDVITRFTKRRRMFYGCSRYPACDFASWQKPQ